MVLVKRGYLRIISQTERPEHYRHTIFISGKWFTISTRPFYSSRLDGGQQASRLWDKYPAIFSDYCPATLFIQIRRLTSNELLTKPGSYYCGKFVDNVLKVHCFGDHYEDMSVITGSRDLVLTETPTRVDVFQKPRRCNEAGEEYEDSYWPVSGSHFLIHTDFILDCETYYKECGNVNH